MIHSQYDFVIEIKGTDFASAAHVLAALLDRMQASIFIRDDMRKELKKFFENQQIHEDSTRDITLRY
ncbi:MAG: hypothetical protein RL557_494 [archaeon]|jgi:predicted DNA-binding protein (UPF0278 family)